MAAGSQWCGVCSAYTDHDTAHHAAGGDIAAGDRVRVQFEGRTYDGRVEDTRGMRAKVAFSVGRARTHSQWFDRESIVRLES